MILDRLLDLPLSAKSEEIKISPARISFAIRLIFICLTPHSEVVIQPSSSPSMDYECSGFKIFAIS